MEDIEELKKQKEEYLNGWKRERADFINYKKEEMERIDGLIKYAHEELVLKILPILDHFYIALKEMPDEGFSKIKDQFIHFLKSQGVEEIKTEGEKFDPNFHEAIEEVEGDESGIIIEEVKKGYIMKGKVIRPAKVKVIK